MIIDIGLNYVCRGMFMTEILPNRKSRQASCPQKFGDIFGCILNDFLLYEKLNAFFGLLVEQHLADFVDALASIDIAFLN